MKKSRAAIVPLMFFAVCVAAMKDPAAVFPAQSAAAALDSSSPSSRFTSKDLDASMKYYEKVSSSEKLTPNDRLAILRRIREKYASSKLDTSVLEKEIAEQSRLRSERLSEKKSSPIPLAETARSGTAEKSARSERPPVSSARRFSDINVVEKADEFEIALVTDKPDSRNIFVLKDPDPAVPPKIVADFYGLTESLPASKKDIVFGSAGVERIKTVQFEKSPSPVARMVVYLKKTARHSIKETPSGFMLLIEKDDSEKGKVATAFAPSAATAPPAKEEPAPAVGPKALAAIGVSSPAISSDGPSAAARSNYKIEPGDVLYVSVSPAEEITREVTVNPGGEISLPLAGVIRAAGLTPSRLAEDIKISLSKYITNPDVSVTLRQYARRAIFITGELKSTGGYVYKENMKLLELISQAGGFTDRADRKNVKVLRGEGSGRKAFRVDVEELARSGDFSKDFSLEPGDIVEVPTGFKKISVLGDVRNPGNYDFRDGLHIVEVVSLSGGFLDTARIKEISVLRKRGAETKTVKVDLDAILKGAKSDFPLAPEDTIYVPRKTISSANWWVTNVMPWFSLVAVILLIRGGV